MPEFLFSDVQSFAHFLKQVGLKVGALVVCRRLGAPKRQTQCLRKASKTVSVFWSGMGIASPYFEKWSTMTKQEPVAIFGLGQTGSTA